MLLVKLAYFPRVHLKYLFCILLAINEFSIEIPTHAEFLGFELPVLLRAIAMCIISIIYISMKKKRF